MPLPTPKKDDKKKEFMDRCMSDKTMTEEYPKNSQRYAVCLKQWSKRSSRNR